MLVDSAAQRGQRLGDASEVRTRMQARLIRDMNPWPFNQRYRLHELAIESEIPSERCILVQTVDFRLAVIVQWRMEVTVDPIKRGDLMLADRLVDRGDGRQACIPDRLCVIPSKLFDQLAHPRIRHHREAVSYTH